MELMQITWFWLVVFFLCGYTILDGFDLGVGILNPYLTRGKDEKSQLFSSVGPFWDGNEVWLLGGGVGLFAAFPPVYATVFSGFYLALMLVLFALIFRAVSLEFWHYDEGRRGIWSHAFTFGSLIPALLFGVAMGNILQGVPLDANTDFAGNFFTLLRPFPLALGVYGLAAFALHGALYAGLKMDGAVQARAQRIVRPLALTVMTLLLITVGLAFMALPFARGNALAWLMIGLTTLLPLLIIHLSRTGQAGKAFAASAASLGTLWLSAGLIQFPVLLRAADGQSHLTLYNSSSSPLTLKAMLIIALIGMPFVLGYTIYVYRVFTRKPGQGSPPSHLF